LKFEEIRKFAKWRVASIYKGPVASFPPKIVNLELTNKCNLNCSYCPVPQINAERGLMNLSTVEQVLSQIGGYDLLLRLHVGGESLLHPELDKIVEKASSSGVKTSISTNGTLLSKDKAYLLSNHLDRIIISNPEEAKTEGLNYLSSNNTEAEVLAQTIGENSPDENLPSWADGWDKRPRLTWAGRAGYSKLGKFIPCKHIWKEIVVKWDGKVVPCCVDMGNELALGGIDDSTLRELWNGEQMQNLRRRHLNASVQDCLCEKCESCYYEPVMNKVKKLFYEKSSPLAFSLISDMFWTIHPDRETTLSLPWRGVYLSRHEGQKMRIHSRKILQSLSQTRPYQRYLELGGGETAVDAGACIGSDTCHMAREVGEKGTIISIEPDPVNYRLLINNVDKFSNIVTLNKATWSSQGEMELKLKERKTEHSLIENHHDDAVPVGKKVKVSTQTLDNIYEKVGLTPDMLKINVEGAEVETLKGGKNCLKNSNKIFATTDHRNGSGEYTTQQVVGRLKNFYTNVKHVEPKKYRYVVGKDG